MNRTLKYQNQRKVWWKPGEAMHEPKKLDPLTWKIFCQDGIRILPGNSAMVALSFGIEISEGVVLVALVKDLLKLKCSIQNGVVIENTSDIIIILHNYHASEALDILPGQELCLLRYV